MTVSCQLGCGGSLVLTPSGTAIHAVQMSFLDVESMRAEPLTYPAIARFLLSPKWAAFKVPKITAAPGGRLCAVAVASFKGAPPPKPNTSTPTGRRVGRR